MGLYLGDKQSVIYKGDAQPVNLYHGSHKIAGWRLQEQTGPDLAFEGAYNDHALIAAQGKSVQIGEPSPNNPAPIYAANGDLVVEGQNIAATPTYFAGGSFNHSVYCQGELLPNTQYTISMIIPSGEMYYLNENLSTKNFGTPIGTGQRYVTTITTKSTISKINDLTYTPSRGWIIFKNQNGYASTTQDKKLMIERGIISHLYTPYRPPVKLPLPELRGMPDGQGGWIARDKLEVVGGRLKYTQWVDPAIDSHTTASIVGASQYVLSPPIITDLGPIDLPTHYPFTRIRTQANAQTHGDLLPEVTARCRVVDVSS